MRIALVALALTVAVDSVRAGDPPLRHDPFHRPARSVASLETGRDGTAWRPELRATLVGAGESLANLGGVILRIGEETRGYQLIEVREQEATFLKGEARVVLHVAAGERGR